MLQFELPFPVSANRQWRNVGYRTLLSREGRQYRQAVCAKLANRVSSPLEGSLEVLITIHPPDRRRHDLDNLHKSLLDAMQHAGVYRDDSQIDDLHIMRANVVAGGKAVVRINEIGAKSAERNG